MHGVMRFVGDASGLSLARPSQARKRAAEPSSWSVPNSPASLASGAQQPTLKKQARHEAPPPAPLTRDRRGSLCSSDEQDESDDEEDEDDAQPACETACVDEGGMVTFVPSVPPPLSLGACNSGSGRPYVTSSIRLNVGGVLYQTSLQTLLSPASADSYFSARFGSAHFRETASPFDGAFFIDRDGTHFRHVLNWLRDGTPCALSDLDSLCQLKMEADFYQLQGLQCALADRIAEIRLERMRLPDAPSRRATALPPPPPPQVSRSMVAARASKPGHRNLFVSNWGAPQQHQPVSHCSSALQSYLQQLPSLVQQPPHSALVPARTHSCPSDSRSHGTQAADASMGAPLAMSTPRRSFASPHPMHDLDCTPVCQRSGGGYCNDSDEEEEENRQQQQQQAQYQQQSRGCSNSPFEFSIDEDF